MEKLIVQFIRLMIDWLPYAVGRVIIFILTWGHARCESWEPVVWRSDLLICPLWKRVGAEIIVTRCGARWVGVLVIFAALIGICAWVLLFVSKL